VHFRQIVRSKNPVSAEVFLGETHEIAGRRERRAECEARPPMCVLHRQRSQNTRTQEVFVALTGPPGCCQHSQIERNIAVSKSATRPGDEGNVSQTLPGLRLWLVCIVEA